MTKRTLMALALVFGVSGAASAQATITMSATVGNSASATANKQAVAFGSVTPGGSTDFTANGYQEYTTNKTGSAVAVAVTTQMTDGTNTLPMSIQCSEANNSATAPATFGSCSTTLTYGGSGVATRRVWVQGTVLATDVNSAAAGTYNGVITFTLTP